MTEIDPDLSGIQDPIAARYVRYGRSSLGIALFFAIVLIAALYASFAHAEDSLPAGYTCEDVRRVVAEHGKFRAWVLAIEQGISPRQIYLIRKQCKV